MGKTIGEILTEAEKSGWAFALPKIPAEVLGMDLPRGLSATSLVEGPGCFAVSRLLLEALGGKARIIEVKTERGNHAYVIPDGASGEDMPLNDTQGWGLNVSEVMHLGKDVTKWTKRQSWSDLL